MGSQTSRAGQQERAKGAVGRTVVRVTADRVPGEPEVVACVELDDGTVMHVTRVAEKLRPPDPKVGDEVYVPTAMFIDHGEDDVLGGRATVSRTRVERLGTRRYCWVSVKELPGSNYSWDYLLDHQAEWKKEYGRRRARPDPE